MDEPSSSSPPRHGLEKVSPPPTALSRSSSLIKLNRFCPVFLCSSCMASSQTCRCLDLVGRSSQIRHVFARRVLHDLCMWLSAASCVSDASCFAAVVAPSHVFRVVRRSAPFGGRHRYLYHSPHKRQLLQWTNKRTDPAMPGKAILFVKCWRLPLIRSVVSGAL